MTTYVVTSFLANRWQCDLSQFFIYVPDDIIFGLLVKMNDLVKCNDDTMAPTIIAIMHQTKVTLFERFECESGKISGTELNFIERYENAQRFQTFQALIEYETYCIGCKRFKIGS